MFAFAQSEDEEASPTFGIKLDREVVMAIIEGKTYENVTIELKAAKLGHVPSGVKIIARDTKSGKKIYKKRFPNSFLYGFSDGSIVVGKGNVLAQVIILKDKAYHVWIAEIRGKGIYH